MRVIPKKTKIKNTIWKNYSIKDIVIALLLLGIVLFLLIKGQIIVSLIITLVIIILFIPTPDGIFYNFIIDNVKFLFSKKKYNQKNLNEIIKIINIKDITNNGIITFYDETFAMVIKLGQKNFGIEDLSEQDTDILYFANALNQLEINQSLDIIKIDRPVNFDNFADELFNKINDNKKERKTKIDKIKGNILKERIDHIDQLNNIFKQYASEFYAVVYSNKLREIEMITNNIASEIKKCGIDTKVLNKNETAIFLKYNLQRNFDERKIQQLKEEEIIDWIIPKKIKFSSKNYFIDNTEMSTIFINDYPLKVKNAWGNNLFNIPDTKVVLKIRPVDQNKAIKRIDNCISELETREILSKKISDSKKANIHKETLVDLLNSLQAENENLFDFSISITAYNNSNDPNYKRKVKKILMHDNFKTSLMYNLQKKAFLCSYINNNFLEKYEQGINSMSLAAIFPFIRSYIMDEGGVVLGKNKYNEYPFIFNIWKRSNMYHNSNAMIIGKSGSGKSFFLKNLIVNEWSNNTRIIICDPEAEYLNLTKKLGGNIIDVGNAIEGRINPFHVYPILTDDGRPADSNITFNTHLKMLESFFKIVLNDASIVSLELINSLVIDAYAKKGINFNTKFNKLKANDYPIFSDLLAIVEEKIDQSSFEKDELLLIKLYLQKFVHGRYSDIWNHSSTLEVNANIINFNFQSLFANKNNIIANAQMLLVFRFIEQEIINNKEYKNSINTMVLCDEAHLFIDEKYPIALDFFYQMNKRIRKYHGSFIPATQNISDWNGNIELKHKTSTILKNSQYLFIFKLSAPDMKDVIDVYKIGKGFNEEEQKIITTLGTGECFFVGSTEKRAVLKIMSGDYIKKVFEERID